MYRLADVAVVDPRDGSITPHQDVWIADGRIAEIGETVGGDTDATTVDAAGRFLAPGFIDTHAHPLNVADPTAELRLMLGFGITGYRQMSGTSELRERRAAGSQPEGDDLPRLLVTPGPVLTPFNAATDELAVAEVRRQAAAGADFIKLGQVTPEVYFTVQSEADRLGLPVVGHLPAGIDVRAASRAGLRSIEHVGPGLGVLAGCSVHEQALLGVASGRPMGAPGGAPLDEAAAEQALRMLVVNPVQMTSPAAVQAIREALETFDEDKARDLARRFAADGTWNCPTLIRVKTEQLCDAPEFAGDSDLRYVAAEDRAIWDRASTAFHTTFDDDQRAVFAEQFALQQRIVKILDEEGAPLLAGTDSGGGAVWVVPGASLHDEFDLLAQAGISPLRILQATTTDPARFLHLEDRSGTVEVGKDADLVLLDADPTVDVAALHAISGVVRAGRHYDAAALTALREQATGR